MENFKMQNSESHDELFNYIEEMKKLYMVLLTFLEDSGELDEDIYNFEELNNILKKQKILQEKQKLKSFLLLILNIYNNHHRSPFFFNKIERIFGILEKTIKKTFSKDQLFNIFASNKLILLLLFERGIIDVNESICEYFLNDDKKNQNYCHFFYPEINNFLSDEKLNEIEQQLLEYDPEKRKAGENESYICTLIRSDAVEEFISYVNYAKIPLSSTIKHSIYETNSFLIDKCPTLIEYAAFYGSIQIFKFLVFNKVKLDENIWLYAIHSNNADLIHNIEEIDIIKNDQIIEQIYLESIKCHHNYLSEYIENNMLSIDREDEYNEKIISTILKYYNYLYFPKEIEQNFAFYYLCKYKYSSIIRLFLKTIKIEKEITNEKLLTKAAEENKIHIAYFLLRKRLSHKKQNKIREKTFYECHNLKKFSIPPNIKTICEYSFDECTSLTEIYIPNSIKTIERCTFYGCSSLTEIYIPKSVTSIASHSFRECSSIQKVIIPSTVTSIGSYAFDRCYKLAHITISESVTKIGECAFFECTSLNSIFLPSSLTIIKSHAIHGCSSLTQINIPKSINQICKGFMKLCTSLLTITIPSSIKIIESYSFSECSSLAQILFENPSLLKEIEKCAFYECSSLKQIKIPSSVTSIGNYAFERCSSLTNIEFEIPSSLKTIGKNCFAECKSLTRLLIPSSVISYELHSFKGFKSLTQITIPSSVTSIGNSIFERCSSLAQITIPSSVTSIGNSAFEGCSSLAQITIPSSVTSIGNSAFEGCSSLTQITIPSSVTSIGNSAFYECSSLIRITIPSSVISIENSTLYRCSSLTQITIPSSVISIGECAFYECSSLTQITIPSSVTSIGERAFYECSSLTQITIPSSVTSIGNSAFEGCSSVIQILIPSSITQFGTKIFEGILKFRVTGNITIIPYELFSDCTSLTEIIIPSSVEVIENYAFCNCTSLQQVTIENPSSLNLIGNFVFYHCFSLKEITIPSSIISISDYSFYISPNNMKRMKKVSMIKKDDICEHYLVEDIKSEKLFDEIIFHPKIINYSKVENKRILQSLFSILQIDHPLIQKYYEFDESKNDKKLCLLAEYFNQRNLQEVFENKKAKMNDTQKLINIYGIALAISYLHRNEILHYELNPSNILEDEEYHPKIINYGISNICKKKGLITFNTLKYSSIYKAPEFFKNNKYDKSSEVYAFSLILYEIITNRKPFKKMTLIKFLEKINKKKRPKLYNDIREPYRNLIERCWSEIPEERPKFEAIVKEIKENEQFITENINANEFQEYIDSIELSIKNQILEIQKEIKTNEIRIIKDDEHNTSTKSFISTYSDKAFHKSDTKKYPKKNHIQKIFKIDDIKCIQKIKKEVIFHSSLLSIVKYIGYNQYNFDHNQCMPIFRIMKDMKNDSLEQNIRKSTGELNNTARLINIYGIALIMKNLHSKNIAYKNDKPGNVHVDSKLYQNLIDDTESQTDNSDIGTAAYIAPEIWTEQCYSRSSDVYAFGFLVYTLMTNSIPFEGLSDEQICYQIVINHFRPNFGDAIDNCYKNLIEKCWDDNKDKRPTFEWIVDELRNNKEFIIKDVDVEEFKNYIELLDNRS